MIDTNAYRRKWTFTNWKLRSKNSSVVLWIQMNSVHSTIKKKSKAHGNYDLTHTHTQIRSTKYNFSRWNQWIIDWSEKWGETSDRVRLPIQNESRSFDTYPKSFRIPWKSVYLFLGDMNIRWTWGFSDILVRCHSVY